jgi:membrane associated rhomboid family serine protease
VDNRRWHRERLAAARRRDGAVPDTGELLNLPTEAPGSALLLGTITVFSLIGLYLRPAWIEQNLLRPYWLVRRAQYRTLVTSTFIHASLAHLFFNAFTFWAFAFALERAIGTARFLSLYACGALASGLGTYFKNRNDPNYCSLGASGAILAVLFASIVYFPKASIFILPLPFPIPAPWFAFGYLAFSYFAAQRNRGQINHEAHFVGALAGLAFVAITDPHALLSALRSLVA